MYFSYQKIIKNIEHREQVNLKDFDILPNDNKRVYYHYKSNPTKLIKISKNQEKWQEGHKQSLSE